MAETKTHKTELRIERSFHASPETVFDAFTEPTAMRVWWTENTSFEIDLRVVQPAWLRHLVLQVADDVLEVRPARVAQEVASAARAALRAYGEAV